MSRRVVAWSVFAWSAVLMAAGAVIPFVWGAGWSALGNPMSVTSAAAPVSVVGLLITLRRPENRIGWSFAAAGAVSAVQTFTVAYADAAFRPAGPALPLAAYAANLTQWIFTPAVLLGYILPFLWFPDGRRVSPRWRRVPLLAAISTGVASVANMLTPGPLNNYPHVTNPLGVGLGALAAIAGLAQFLFIGTLFVSVVSVVLRYRRSRGVERLQMRWFVVGVAGTAVAFGAMLVMVIATGDVGAATLLMAIMPVCAAIAILRYRLFEIDRVISRTVSYALVTALIGAPYIVLALMAGRLESGSGITVAALTLAALAVFRPVRRSVQARVDRKFNRARYDGARTIEAFAVRLRDEVDPDVVTADLLTVAASAVEPVAMSLWMAP